MISIEHEDGMTIVGVFGEFELADYRRFEDEVMYDFLERFDPKRQPPNAMARPARAGPDSRNTRPARPWRAVV